MALTWGSDDTSVGHITALAPMAMISSCTVASLTASISARTRRAPSRAKILAVARPMPLEAPVIMALLPFRRPDMSLS